MQYTMNDLSNKADRDSFTESAICVDIAFQITKIRIDMGISREDLANRLGISLSTLSRWENPNHTMSISNLKKLASVFDIGLLVAFVPFSESIQNSNIIRNVPKSYDSENILQ